MMILSAALSAAGQENIITAGVQFKPIFSSRYFNTGPQVADSSGIGFEMVPNGGYCVGGLVRFGISKRVSGETGINFVKRAHKLIITDEGRGITEESSFSIIGYEIPLTALVFIQLSEITYMDVSLGLAFDFFPSNVTSNGTYFQQFTDRESWVFPAISGNVGYEIRTYKSGYFYIGASYHRPFGDIYRSTAGYYVDDNYFTGQQFLLSGNYLTVDFRYFFHEDPLKKQRRDRKNR